MQFTFDVNADAVEAGLVELERSLEGSGASPREMKDDFGDLLATPASTTRLRGRTMILGPRELGETGKVKG